MTIKYGGGQDKPFPIISQNTEAMLNYQTKYATGTAKVVLPYKQGIRYIIKKVVAANPSKLEVGFGTANGTIVSSIFSIATTVTNTFFDNAYFAQASPASVPDDTNSNLIIDVGQNAVLVAYVEFAN